MSFETIWEDKGILWEFHAELTDADLLESNLNLYESPRFMEINYELCDFTRVERISVSNEVIRKVAEMDEKASIRDPSIKAAIVTDSPLLHGLARMYELTGFENHWEIQIFKDVISARKWIAERLPPGARRTLF